jgi:hypothetical protein
MKGAISNGAKKGMLSTYAIFLKCLQAYLTRNQNKKKKTGASGDAADEDELSTSLEVVIEDEETMMATVIDTVMGLPLLRILHALTLFLLMWYVDVRPASSCHLRSWFGCFVVVVDARPDPHVLMQVRHGFKLENQSS